METAMMNSICRCCATEGVFKCVTIAYTWMGEEEIYADMLKECFDINLNLSESGEDGGICEVCITQLRNASNFKKQVLSTEEQLKKHAENKLFKPNIVKVEVTRNDDDSDDNMSAEEAYSGPEFEVPIKTETEESKPKKRTMATRASTSGAKKSKDDDAGETSTKRPGQENRVIRIERPSKPSIELKFISRRSTGFGRDENIAAKNSLTEIASNRLNLKHILLYSNATPIRCKGSFGYVCVFCPKQFPEPTKLKKHVLHEHNDDNLIKRMSSKIRQNIIKLDITYLNCALCDKDIAKLDDFILHLKNEHKKQMILDIKTHIIPFKFDTPELKCAICTTKFDTFKILQEHMNSHFGNYACDLCGAGFVTKQLRRNHTKRHGSGEFKCEQCDKTFDTETKKTEHKKRTHLGFNARHKCKFCSKRFVDYWKRMNHMVKKHGEPPVILKCSACDRTFDNRKTLSRHKKKDHLLERPHKCGECDMSFFSKSSMVKHMTKHTGLRQFKCDICLKSYSRRTTLIGHMRIHTNDRRFSCVHCGQAFVQKCSWRSHMRSKHGEEV